MSWLSWRGGKKKKTQAEWAAGILERGQIPVILHPPAGDVIRVRAGGDVTLWPFLQKIEERFVPRGRSAYFHIKDGDDYRQPAGHYTMSELYYEYQQHDRCMHIFYGLWELYGNDMTPLYLILGVSIFLVLSPWYLFTYLKGIVFGGEPSENQNVRGDGKDRMEPGGTGDSDKQR
ncbi:hypothetical protein LCI18_004000 [Fusarium solani-melongenae]|uniref:Uncharacterized protein n=1 Tax=Fusarium solani subsp. cucurbitae TaxID=2747967 RepID=A0ACD3YVW4_FUSSC|nr:hypothetical protein LCI18_004000 [Fusarium solani-melongenae]